MDRIDFDHHDFAALGILIDICDRKLGRQSAVCRALNGLREAPNEATFERARTTFDKLPAGARASIAEQANRAARESRRAFTDVRQQLNGLLSAINRRPGVDRRLA